MVVSDRTQDRDVEAELRSSLEHALKIADRMVAIKEQELETARQLAAGLRQQVDQHRDGVEDEDTEHPVGYGSMTDGIRTFLEARAEDPDPLLRTATAKEVETWLIRKGYRTQAKNFYWSVYGALRMAKEVVGVVKEGETTRFALKDALPRAPEGWRLTNFPRRNSLASRRAQPTPKAKSAKGR